MPCPDNDRWRDLLDGELSTSVSQREEILQHLNACARCQQVVEGLTANTDVWAGAARALEEQPQDPTLSRIMAELKQEGGAGERPCVAPLSLDFLAPPEKPGQLGKLGIYEVLREIGRGGMSVVFKAFDPALNRFVAIKVLAPQWASSGAARNRFAREARATAAVRHDNVVAIHAVEEAQLPYLVMEYVHGTSLQERFDRTGPFELIEVLRIGLQTAAGLEAAHAQGLIHRDVKPSNILLEQGVDRVKLSDFGLARAIDDASLTQSGCIAGTPQYMAPEQAQGKPLGPRADLFSLGSVLYALCTGRPPFRAPSTVAVLKRVCEEEPRSIREINPDIPEWFTQIIARLHAKRPEDRFPSAGEVSRLLAQHLAHLQHPDRVPMPRSRSPRRRWPLAVAAGCLSVVLIGCGTLGALGWGMTYLVSKMFSALPANPGPPLPPRPAPRAELSGGKLERGKDGGLVFSVEYELRPGARDATLRYVWTVRAGERVLHEKKFRQDELGKEGVLTAKARPRRTEPKGPIETYLECERLVPGQMGWQRERISNVVKLVP